MSEPNILSWELLERHSQLVTETGCRLWTGCQRPEGYGLIRAQGKLWRAHVAAMALSGHDVAGKCVLHKCDTPACCNPEHLFLGSRSENARDRDQKARVAHGARHYAARLTTMQVNEIRNDPRPQQIIADEYGVSNGHISTIKSGKSRRRG